MHKVDQTKAKALVHSVQHVAAIAEETAAGVQEVNSTSIQQNTSVRRLADQADEMNNLSQQLFQEIKKFRIDSDE